MTRRSRRLGVRLGAGASIAGAAIAVLLGSTGAAQEPPVPLPPVPLPERGVAVVVEPVSGRVLVRPRGAEDFRTLAASERLPVGGTVDATDGKVRVTAARNRRGDTWSAVFSEGSFIVRQPTTGAPVTTLRLTGPRLRDVCRDRAGASATGRKRVRRLWGDGKGRFRTRGRYSAATVRGTKWLTEDRCDGTLTRVVRGSVEVEDFTAEPEPPDDGSQPTPEPLPGAGGDGGGGSGVVVAAGRSYVARPGR